MKISVEWLANGRNADREQAATVSHLQVDIGGANVTEMRREGVMSIRKAVTVPAVVLAEGLAFQWWTLLYGRGRTTRFRNLRQGFALPDVRITPDGEKIAVSASPYTYRNPGVSFLNGGEEYVSEAALRKEISSFVGDVLKRLRTAVSDSALAEQWARIQHSQSDDEERAFCVAAGALGVDPYAGNAEAEHLIARGAQLFAEEELSEFLAGEQPRGGEAALDWFEASEKALNGHAVAPRLSELGGLVAERPSRPWDLGYKAARRARAKLNLAADKRIPTYKELGAVLGNKDFQISDVGSPSLRAVVDTRADQPRVVLGARIQASALFTLARATGDAVCFDLKSPAPVMHIDGSYRQAANRSFAAEFLAPIEAIKVMKAEGWTEEEIAPQFGVADEVIRLQLHNDATRQASAH